MPETIAGLNCSLSTRALNQQKTPELRGFGSHEQFCSVNLCVDLALLVTGGTQKMLWTIMVILLILWLLGFSLHIAGGLIHLLLVVALVILVINLLTGRRVAL